MRLAINLLGEELESAAAVCRREGVGAEVTAFALPAVLDAEGFADTVERHRAALEGIAPLTCHGPFLDLYVTSPDPRIVQVCRERHERALRAATALSATVYVAHLNSLPLIRNREYRERFAERAAAFWRPLADVAGEHGITIALENLWEGTPRLQRLVVEAAGHPALKASFDNGHALVFSEVEAPKWVRVLGADLAHCHLHDNDGTSDQHLPIGRGTERWLPLLEAIAAAPADPVVVLECDALERNRECLDALRELLYPSGPQ